jgi:hypothetical protein
MVVIDNGLVTAIRTPPKGTGYRFESDDSWIRDLIVSAYEEGLADSQLGRPPLRAPDGWVLWSDLKPGDIATSGQDWVAISDSEDFKFSNGGCTGRRFASIERGDGPDDAPIDLRFNFDPAQRRSWPFYRVARSGLTGEQILTLLDAVNDAPADETVQATIDRILPVGA